VLRLPERRSCIYTLSELAQLASRELAEDIAVDARMAGRLLLVVAPEQTVEAGQLLAAMAQATGSNWRQVGRVRFLTLYGEPPDVAALRATMQDSNRDVAVLMRFLFASGVPFLTQLSPDDLTVGARAWASLTDDKRNAILQLALASREAAAGSRQRAVLNDDHAMASAVVTLSVITALRAVDKDGLADLGKTYNYIHTNDVSLPALDEEGEAEGVSPPG